MNRQRTLWALLSLGLSLSVSSAWGAVSCSTSSDCSFGGPGNPMECCGGTCTPQHITPGGIDTTCGIPTCGDAVAHYGCSAALSLGEGCCCAASDCSVIPNAYKCIGNACIPNSVCPPDGPASAIGISLSGTPFALGVGSQMTYTVSPYNNGPNPTTNAVVAVSFNVTTQFVSATVSPSNAATCSPVSGGGISCTGNGLPYTVTLVVIPISAGTLTASASIFDANCDPGDNPKNATFSANVTNPAPNLTSMSPTTKTAGEAAFTLTLNGSGFVNSVNGVTGSTVLWNGVARPTSFVSFTQLTAAIPASDIAAPGTAGVQVTNPTPGGGTTSPPLTFTIVPPQLVITPDPGTTTPGGTIHFTAVANNPAGMAVANQPVFNWSSSNPSIGTFVVPTNGAFQAAAAAPLGTYPNLVTASALGATKQASVVIQAGPIATITIDPDPGPTVPGGFVQFTATAKDSGGNKITPSPAFVWSSVHSTLGTIDQTGKFTALTTAVAGLYPQEVSASFGGVTGKAGVQMNVGAIATITIDPDPGPTVPGGSVQFTATAKDSGGNKITPSPVFVWSSVHTTTLGSVDQTGKFTALSSALIGLYTQEVTATFNGVSGKAGVRIDAGAVTTITVDPDPGPTVPGGSVQFTATAKDSGGNKITPSPAFVWSSVHTITLGSVDQTGKFTALSSALVGLYPQEVTATFNGISGKAGVRIDAGAAATITIDPDPGPTVPGGSVQFTATAKDSGGNKITPSPAFVWSSVHSTLGTIDQTGKFTALTTAVAGLYPQEVTASFGGVSGHAAVQMNVGPIATITVDPNPGPTVPGGSVQFTATAKDSGGNKITPPPAFVWSSVHTTTLGSVDQTGKFKTLAGALAGLYPQEVRATFNGISGQAGVLVNTGSAATITIDPDPGPTVPGGSVQFTATAKDSGGNKITPSPAFVWASVHSTLGSIDQTGKFTASASAVSGLYPQEVTASFGGVTGKAGVQMNVGAIATITIDPDPGPTVPGGSVQFTATAKDSGGNKITPSPAFVWSSVHSTLGSIDQAGKFTALTTAVVGLYPQEVTASFGGVNGQAAVRVDPLVIDHITVEPDGQILRLGELLQLRAHLFTRTGLEITGSSFTWSIQGPSGAIFSGAGSLANFRSEGGFFGTRKFTVFAALLAAPNVTGTVPPGSARVTVLIPSPFQDDICGAYAYPVPYKSSDNLPGVTFTKLSAGTKIRIFTSDARIVRTLRSENGENVLWDVRNESGDKVASWVYYYILEQSGGACPKKEGKLVIIQ